MATSDVKLLGSVYSSFVNRVQIALSLKSVKYEFLEEKAGAKSDLLLKSNPVYKKIPVLIHDDPYDRALARFWAAYIDDKWFLTMRDMIMAEGEEAKLAAKERFEEGLPLLEGAFVKYHNGGDFFGGNNIGYIDIAMGSILAWLRASKKIEGIKLIDEAKTPNLAKWAEKFFESVIPKTDSC